MSDKGPTVQAGKTPQGQVQVTTPSAILPQITGNWGQMVNLLGGTPGSRYGTLQFGSRISMSTKLKMLSDPVIAFAVAYISAKLVRAEYKIECADPEIQAFFEAMYSAWHREFMLQASLAVSLGCVGLIKKLDFERPRPIEPGGEEPWPHAVTPYICTGFDQVGPVGAYATFDQETREFTGFEYSGGKVDRIYALWLTIGRHLAFGKYSGWGRLNNSYKSWWLGEFDYDQLAVHIQKYVDRVMLVGFPSGKDDDGNEMQDVAIRIGDQARAGATVALPSGVYPVYDENLGSDKLTAIRKWTIGLLEGAENVSAFTGLADHTDSRKAMGMLVPYQTFQAVRQSSLGGPTTADVLGTLATALLIDDATEIDMHVNQYVFPDILHWNYGPDAPPVTKTTTGLHEADRKELFELLKLLMGNMNSDASSRVDAAGLIHDLGIPEQEADSVPAPAPEPDEESTDEEPETEQAGPQYFAVSPDAYVPGHNGELINRPCPLDGCLGEQAVQFADHGGLCICTTCQRTYDPEIYP